MYFCCFFFFLKKSFFYETDSQTEQLSSFPASVNVSRVLQGRPLVCIKEKRREKKAGFEESVQMWCSWSCRCCCSSHQDRASVREPQSVQEVSRKKNSHQHLSAFQFWNISRVKHFYSKLLNRGATCFCFARRHLHSLTRFLL